MDAHLFFHTRRADNSTRKIDLGHAGLVLWDIGFGNFGVEVGQDI